MSQKRRKAARSRATSAERGASSAGRGATGATGATGARVGAASNAAPATRRTRRRQLAPFYYAIAALMIAGALYIGYSASHRSGRDAGNAPVAAPPAELIRGGRGVTRGDSTALVDVIIFSDYMCPACQAFAMNTDARMRAEFGDRIRETYHDYPLVAIHPYSMLAARAARCAEDQQRFWEYHDILFANQTTWSESSVTPTAQFTAYAGVVHLDTKQFGACMNSDAHTDLVLGNLHLGQAMGVDVTPTIFINGRKSARPNNWGTLEDEINQALKEAIQ